MEQNTYKLTINNPCSQKWASMKQNETGKYCSHCSKTVIDFTKLTDREIICIVGQTSGKLCGRLTHLQLNRFLEYNRRPTHSKFYKIFAGLLLAGTTERSYPTSKPIFKSEIISVANNKKLARQESKTNDSPIEDSLKNLVQGKIFDAYTKEPVPFASVLIKETETKVSTDIDGQFKITLPESLMAEKITLIVMYLGYEKIEVTFDRKDLPITKEFLMIPYEQILTGEVCVTKKKKHRWQFWK